MVNNSQGKQITTMCRLWMAFKQILKGPHRNVKVYKSINYNDQLPSFVEPPGMNKVHESKDKQIEAVKNMIEEKKYDFIINTDGSTLKDNWLSCGKSGAAAVYT